MPVLTVASVQKYAANAKRREIPDARATGLYLVVQPKPSGAKSWALRFRKPDGKTTGKMKSAKMWLGPVDFSERETKDDPVIGAPLTLGQARVLAAQIARKRERGIDVIAEQKAAEERKKAVAAAHAVNTFGACVREFFIEYRTKKQKIRPRRWRENASLLGLYYKPGSDPATTEPKLIDGGLASTWADKAVASIDGHDVHTVVKAAKVSSDARARKLHTALSGLFTWLVQERRVTANPCKGVARPGASDPRERVLTDAEIVLFWHACDQIGAPFGPLFKVLLLVGCRLREAARMTHSELDDDGVWTIPGARTKNHRPLSLALPPLVRQIISSVPVIQSSAGYVFTTNGRTPVSGFSRAKKLLDAAMAKSAGHAVPQFRLHDLRRTFATGMAGLGVALPVVEKLLNHVSGSFAGVVGIYQRHAYVAEKTEALARWAKHVEGLVEGKSKVVPLRGKKEA